MFLLEFRYFLEKIGDFWFLKGGNLPPSRPRGSSRWGKYFPFGLGGMGPILSYGF